MQTLGQPFSEGVRERILEADKYTCAYCGGPATEVDHIDPLSKGGGNDIENGVACCERCNRKKGAKLNIRWLTRAYFRVLGRDVSKRPLALQEAERIDTERIGNTDGHFKKPPKSMGNRKGATNIPRSTDIDGPLWNQHKPVVAEPVTHRPHRVNAIGEAKPKGSRLIAFRVPDKYLATLEALAAAKGLTPQEYLKRRSIRHLIGMRGIAPVVEKVDAGGQSASEAPNA